MRLDVNTHAANSDRLPAPIDDLRRITASECLRDALSL